MEKLAGEGCDVLINTTPIGMHPNIDASPIDAHSPAFSADMLVFDTIYNPLETRLMRDTKAGGAKVVGGIEMFVRQAAGQFEDWTRQPAPIALFRQIIQARLTA